MSRDSLVLVCDAADAVLGTEEAVQANDALLREVCKAGAVVRHEYDSSSGCTTIALRVNGVAMGCGTDRDSFKACVLAVRDMLGRA